jgi:excisionase family DNA binding protein
VIARELPQSEERLRRRDLADLCWSGREDLNLRDPAPKTTDEPSQALTTVHNHREPLDSGSSTASSGRKYSPHFTGDLLHPYFGADSRLLTVSDVAKRLRICDATVYKLCATGTLRHVRVLNSIRVTDAGLQDFVARQLHREI